MTTFYQIALTCHTCLAPVRQLTLRISGLYIKGKWWQSCFIKWKENLDPSKTGTLSWPECPLCFRVSVWATQWAVHSRHAWSGNRSERRNAGSRPLSTPTAPRLRGKAPSALPQQQNRLSERKSCGNYKMPRKVDRETKIEWIPIVAKLNHGFSWSSMSIHIRMNSKECFVIWCGQ